MEQIYHVFSRSIAEFKIFNDNSEFARLISGIRYYQLENPEIRFCKVIQQNKDKNTPSPVNMSLIQHKKILDIIAYCIMPTHLHFVIKPILENSIPTFIGNLLNSYSRYFNIKHNRKGPLWEGRYRKVLVDSDEQLLHLTRYVHLNPVTAYLVNKPEDWPASSYREYLSITADGDRICKYDGLLDIDPIAYRKFTEDRISYQRNLAKIKKIMLE